jgi:DNA-binding transcriptional MocR family regulator
MSARALDARKRGQRDATIEGTSAAAIADSIETAIHRGLFAPGEQLPTVRGLATELGVSTVTVATAYRNLQQRALVVGDGRRGTRVRSEIATTYTSETPPPAGVRDLALGNPDPALLPSLAHGRRNSDGEPSLYGERANLPTLIELVRALLRADGVAADNLAVVSGALDGIERVLSTSCRPGDRVAVEDPGFPRLFDLLRSLGLDTVPVTCDERGPQPEALEQALRGRVRAVLFTARAQNPTGAAIDAERARQLRALLARSPDVLVIEDDYASRIAGVELHTLTPKRTRWAHIRSYSKSLGPDLRVGFLAGDETTTARVEERQRLGAGWVSHILQHLTHRFLVDRQTDRLLARAEKTYRDRREGLISALAEHGIAASGSSGFNVWIHVPEEAHLVRSLYEAGWAVSAGERFRISTPPAIRVTVSTLEQAEAEQLAVEIARNLHSQVRTRAG